MGDVSFARLNARAAGKLVFLRETQNLSAAFLPAMRDVSLLSFARRRW